MAKKGSSNAILSRLSSHRSELRRYGVKRIGIFGSAARGTATRKSDLDFLVKFEKLTFDSYMDLKFMLERMFGKKVDLVTEETIKPALGHVKHEARYLRL